MVAVVVVGVLVLLGTLYALSDPLGILALPLVVFLAAVAIAAIYGTRAGFGVLDDDRGL